MHKRFYLLLLLGALSLAGIFFIIIGKLANRSLVSFESDPEAEVYIDNKKIGTTPIEFETNKENILVSIKISGNNGYLPYETALSLTPHTKVIVRHNFSTDVGVDSNQIFQFLKTNEKAGLVTIISEPSNADIFVDGAYVGKTPLRLSPTEGTHTVKILKNDFKDFETHIQNKSFYNLILSLTLSRNSGKKADNLAQKQIATVLKNQYGYVSVHKGENDATEISRVLADHEYEVIGFNESKNFVQIKLNASESGWLASKYVSIR